jgi:hypothetical protein
MEMKELNDLFERAIGEAGDAPNPDYALALAVRVSGMQIANGLAMVAQNLGEIREEMLNQRLTSRGQAPQ